MCDHAWLPKLMPFVDDGSGFPGYERRLYAAFVAALVTTQATFMGAPVIVPSRADASGMLDKFFHVITGHFQLNPNNKREYKLDRCESVPWIRPIIDGAAIPRLVRVWREWYSQNQEHRWHVALAGFCYIVVLVERPNGFQLITAFPTRYEHEREKYRRRYERETGAP